MNSNLKLIKNDAFYNADFDDRIFLYWMLKWLNIDTTNNNSRTALKNMAKKFVEEILGEKLDAEDFEIYFSDFRNNDEKGSFTQRISIESSVLLIINRKDKKERKYIYFRDFCEYEYSTVFLEDRQKIFRLLRKYENLEDNEMDKIKIVYFKSEKIDKYEKEEAEEVTTVYDIDKFLKLFETFEKDIDDSIFDSYHNYVKSKNDIKSMKHFSVYGLYCILERYLNEKNENYDVYESFNSLRWIKDKFFVEMFYERLKDSKRFMFILKWFSLDKIQDKDIKLIQNDLKNIFNEFEIIDYTKMENDSKEIPLMSLEIDKNSSLKEIKNLVDEITKKLEIFNQLKRSQDMRNDYAEYNESDKLKNIIRLRY